MIAARQETDLRPQLERLDRLVLASARVAPGALSFTFRPLWQMDAATKSATPLQKAQATGIYAGLGLWPKAVMAGLVAGQLAEDGIYPGAGAAFEAGAQTNDLQQPVRDYSPDQPRDPQGRWTRGVEEPQRDNRRALPARTAPPRLPRSLTIHPHLSLSSSERTASSSEPNRARSLLGMIGNALSHLNPISSAHAEETKASGGQDAPVSLVANGLPDLTPTEPLAGLGKGPGGIIAGLALRAVRFGAAKFLRWLQERDSGSDPDTNGSVGNPAGGASQSGPSTSSGRITFPENDAQLKNIFRNKSGHFPDTEANCKLLEDLANDITNISGPPASNGNTWFSKIMPNGNQIWASVRNGRIGNAGINSSPRAFNSKTGLSSPIRPDQYEFRDVYDK